MKTNRRDFLTSAALTAGGTSLLGLTSCAQATVERESRPDYSVLDEALQRPVLRREARDANGTIIPYEPKAGPFESRGGVIRAPEGAGLGITIDPDYIATHRVFTG